MVAISAPPSGSSAVLSVALDDIVLLLVVGMMEGGYNLCLVRWGCSAL